MFVISFNTAPFHFIFFLPILNCGNSTTVYNNIPIPDINWDITVAKAAPPTPYSNFSTNIKSNAIFNTAETPRKINGTTEFPIALKREVK